MIFKSPPPAKPGEINYNFLDFFTIVHFLIGVLYGAIGLSLVVAVTLAVGWELIENPLKAGFPTLFPNATADTWKNSIGDIIAVLVGWWLLTYLISVF